MGQTKFSDVTSLFKDQEEMQQSQVFVPQSNLSNFWTSINIKSKKQFQLALMDKAQSIPK
jgi:hypothetical protein